MTSDRFTRRGFLKSAGLSAAAVAFSGCLKSLSVVAANRDDKKLNFVFMLIDDLGWADVGCYGSRFYETPNIDKLAAQGMRFTNAYAACPVCSPTRGSIMTGRYPARLNITDWIPGDQASRNKPYRSEKLIAPDFNLQLPLNEVTIAEALKKAGYASCSVGKWHLGKEPFYPDKQGFDINIAGNDKGSPPTYFFPYMRKGRARLDLAGGKPGEYLTDRLTDEALKWLEANKDRPFFLYFPHYAVHTPIQARRELIEKYQVKAKGYRRTSSADYRAERHYSVTKLKQNDPVYAAMVHSVDESVGRVMNKLKELGIADNTAVIFMSDNGGLSTHSVRNVFTSNLPLRAGKGWLYEGGIREPMIIKWPGVVKVGSVSAEPVTSTDFYPTILEMAGLDLEPKCHVDGLSLVPLIKGSGSLNREAIYWHYPHYHSSGNRPSGAVRAGRYKLIEWYEDNSVELYDLAEDVSEKNNLAVKMPDKTEQLRQMLHKWRESVDAHMPTPNPDYDPSTKKF